MVLVLASGLQLPSCTLRLLSLPFSGCGPLALVIAPLWTMGSIALPLPLQGFSLPLSIWPQLCYATAWALPLASSNLMCFYGINRTSNHPYWSQIQTTSINPNTIRKPSGCNKNSPYTGFQYNIRSLDESPSSSLLLGPTSLQVVNILLADLRVARGHQAIPFSTSCSGVLTLLASGSD